MDPRATWSYEDYKGEYDAGDDRDDNEEDRKSCIYMTDALVQ